MIFGEEVSPSVFGEEVAYLVPQVQLAQWLWTDLASVHSKGFLCIVSSVLSCYRCRWWYCIRFSAGFGCDGSAQHRIRYGTTSAKKRDIEFAFNAECTSCTNS